MKHVNTFIISTLIGLCLYSIPSTGQTVTVSFTTTPAPSFCATSSGSLSTASVNIAFSFPTPAPASRKFYIQLSTASGLFPGIKIDSISIPAVVSGSTSFGSGSKIITMPNVATAGTSYKLLASDSTTGTSGTTGNFSYTKPTFTAAPSTQTICSGPITSINISASGNNIGWTTSVLNGTFLTGPTAALPPASTNTVINQNLVNGSATTIATAQYKIFAVSAAGCVSDTTKDTVIVNPKPTLTATPSTQTICSGIPMTPINISASGNNIGWTTSVLNGTFLTGPTAALPPASTNTIINQPLVNGSSTLVATAQYKIFAVSAAGCVSDTTKDTVIVNPKPIVVSPAKNIGFICSGLTYDSVYSSVPGSTFTWSIVKYGAGITSGVIPGPNQNSFSQQLAYNGPLNSDTAKYSVIVKSPLGGCSSNPDTIKIIVKKAGAITTSYASSSVCSRSTVTINLSSSNGSTSFNWVAYPGANIDTTGFIFTGSGQTITKYLRNKSNAATDTVRFVINSANPGTDCISNVPQFFITVNPSPHNFPPLSKAICNGDSTRVRLSPTTATRRYVWTSSIASGSVSGFRSDSDTIGYINHKLINASDALPAVVRYVIRDTSTLGCVDTITNADTFLVTVNPIPTIRLASPTINRICSKTQVIIPLSASTTSTFTWRIKDTFRVNTQLAPITNNTIGADTIRQTLFTSALDSGLLRYEITATSIAGCVDTLTKRRIDSVYVFPLPKIISPASDTTVAICSGQRVSLKLPRGIEANIAGSSLKWNVVDSSRYISGAKADSGKTTINDILTDSTNNQQVYYIYKVTAIKVNTNLQCVGDTNRYIRVNVNPTPDIITTPVSVCSKALATINLIGRSSTGSGSKFNWHTTTTSPYITGTSLTDVHDTIFQRTFINADSTAPHDVYLVVTPTSAATCEGKKDSIKLTINPLPTLGSAIRDTFICSGLTFVYAPQTSTGNPTSYTYKRFSTLPSAIDTSSGSGIVGINNIINVLKIPEDTFTYKEVKYVFTLTDNATNCVSDTTANLQVVNVRVNPTPAKPGIGLLPNFKICEGASMLNIAAGRDPHSPEYFVWEQTPGVKLFQNDTISNNTKYALASFAASGTQHIKVYALVRGYDCKSGTSDTTITVKPAKGSMFVNVVRFNKNLVAQASDVQGYQWGYDRKSDLSPHDLPGATNQNLIIDGTFKEDSNFYWVLVTFKDTCVQKAYYNAPHGLLGVSHNQLPAVAGILKLYPNPAMDKLTIELADKSADERMRIRIYDISGRQLRNIESRSTKLLIETSEFTPGYYTVTCEVNGVRTATNRFIKQ